MKYTRAYYEKILYNFLSPFVMLYDKEKSSVRIPGEIETSYDIDTMRLESFSRSLLGWAFLKGYENIKTIIFLMIKNGVDSKNDRYWGKVHDNDQKVVEMFPILLFCVENKSLFAKIFDRESQSNLQKWFFQINEIQVPYNNWQFFIILVNRFLQLLGLEYSKKNMDKAFEKINEMYLGNGWYSDGKSMQRDYYIAFAFHYYSLIYSKYSPEDALSKIFVERSKLFSCTFEKFFSKEGNALAFGRSLTYKFAQVAFWSIYSDFISEESEVSYIKGIINRNLCWWLSHEIVDSNGFLHLGYSYGNQFMTEYYNAKGSSYWCLKAFIFLLNKSDLFFDVEPLDFQQKDSMELVPALSSTLIYYNGHSFLFMNGQKSNNEFGNTAAKYEKFLYTTLCAPCVSRSLYGIENLACDNTLVVQIGKSLLVRKYCKVIKVNEDVLISEWAVSPNLLIKSYIFPGAPYHYRVHVVKTNQNMLLYDFGTAVRKDINLNIKIENNIAICNNQHQTSAIYTLKDQGFARICFCSPNVNIQYPKVVIPYTCIEYASGTHYVIDCCYNDVVTMSASKHLPDKIDVIDGVIHYKGKQFDLDDRPSSNISIDSAFMMMMRKIKLMIEYFK